MHKHKCDECGCVWEHERPADGEGKGAHNCPKCSVPQGMRYDGPEPAEFTNHHLKDSA